MDAPNKVTDGGLEPTCMRDGHEIELDPTESETMDAAESVGT